MTTKNSPATERALKLVAKGKMTPYAAAKHEGLALSTVYRALKRLNAAQAATKKGKS